MFGGRCPFGHKPSDPFKAKREAGPVARYEFQGEQIPMILRHAEVRQAAKDWKTFSSDAPFRVPIPSEEEARSMRQLPIETDPPVHGEYRTIAEPYFQRPKLPEMVAKVEALIDEMLRAALARETTEIVHGFALPIQARALTYLLDTDEREADTWIGWGVHVFRVRGGLKKGVELEDYLTRKFDAVSRTPGRCFFSALAQARFQGRPLTREEMMGFANLTFAGGRDTVIHTIACALGHLAANPEALAYLREDPKRIVHAGEEFFRFFMPLTHIGRVCPVATSVHGEQVPAGGRVSLGWASANRDESVFPEPDVFRIDRKPNPHLSFGFGEHLCLGAPHARLLLRTLLQKCVELVDGMEIVSAEERTETEHSYERKLGYESLVLRFRPRA
ncbi:MAG: cytochrome P450 [Verrucomicrobia bacterium]|nr:cytochrome P450 [Verrucomicrobiota bacterium]